MYQCHIQICLAGSPCRTFGLIKKMAPLEHFTHTFVESTDSEAEELRRADVIFANMRDLDAERAYEMFTVNKKKEAELILLVCDDQVEVLAQERFEADDLWIEPLAEHEFRFCFSNWQQAYKLKKDLWQSDQFLQACINGSPDMMWFKSKDGIHEIVNDSFCKVVNKTKEQVQGQKHAYIWNVEEEDPACIESEREVMQKRETCMAGESIQTGEGEKLLTTYKSPLYDCDGSVMGTVGVAIDVTKERAYEQEIVNKNRTMEMLFSTMDCGVMCHSIDGTRLISINQAALRLLGYESQEELMGDSFDMVAQSVVEEDKGKLRGRIKSLTKVGESVGVEYRVRHKDGKVLHILGNVKLIEERGELYYQRFLLDFTVQKKKEEEKVAQKEQEIQYQEQLFDVFSTFLSDNVDDVYMMLNESGDKVEFASPNIERVLGAPWKDVVENLSRLGRAKYITGEEIGREKLAALEPGMSLELMETERVHRVTGEHKWFAESVYCVSIQGIKKIVVYISDRTKEKTAQNTLSDALVMAQVANKAKSTFLSNVSHDIRTPMNAIMGFVTLLREEAESPEHVLEYTQKISAASQHLLGLINDVLDMNKIESGSAVLNISELNLAEIIDEINTIIRPQAKAKEQSFEVFTVSLNNEHLLGDKLRINQILINILSNAVKYTPNGGSIKMWVNELPQVDKNYSRIRFTISDNGRGMSEEYQKVIFEPFTRESNAAWNQAQGTGLGMAITKSLVELMNGSIKVTSRLGEGSTFEVELELHIQEKEEDPEFWDKHSVARMIVADDDENICKDIVKKMSATGVEIQYSVSGAKAIEMIRSAREEGRPYDLILLDWKMPDLDGLATARLIRQNYSSKVPILLFTAYDWGEIEQEALEVGIEHFMSKPFFMSNFKDAIRRMMGTAQKSPETDDDKSVVDGKNILVVDDVDVNRIVLVKILKTLGAECDTAADGQEAVDKFNRSKPGDYDLILMDVQMPVLNGHEATRAIRAGTHPSAQTIPIIAMTANAFVDDIRDALASGMDAHIAKPIVLAQLKSTIREVFERKEKQA
ncbi:MAG: response regulator [Lachnospiraceae bacterium]|nr:response regulator [Lachnospiraceae bacterium]